MRKLGVGIPGGVSMVPGIVIPSKSMGPRVMGMPGITPDMLKLNKRKSGSKSPQKSPSKQPLRSPVLPSKSPLRSPNLSPEDVSFNLFFFFYQKYYILTYFNS